MEIHIKKHGYNVDTEIVGEFYNQVELAIVALKFSKENNIVKSKEWANLNKKMRQTAPKRDTIYR